MEMIAGKRPFLLPDETIVSAGAECPADIYRSRLHIL
jgi:hypothetical protein